MQYTIQLTETLSGLEWFNAAEEALDHRDIEGCPFAALFCVQQSEKKNFPDALALHGYMFEMVKWFAKTLIRQLNIINRLQIRVACGVK